MHLRAQYQGILTSINQTNEQTRIRPQSSGAGKGNQSKNPSPHQRPQRRNQGDLPRLPHQSRCLGAGVRQR